MYNTGISVVKVRHGDSSYIRVGDSGPNWYILKNDVVYDTGHGMAIADFGYVKVSAIDSENLERKFKQRRCWNEDTIELDVPTGGTVRITVDRR